MIHEFLLQFLMVQKARSKKAGTLKTESLEAGRVKLGTLKAGRVIVGTLKAVSLKAVGLRAGSRQNGWLNHFSGNFLKPQSREITSTHKL